MTQQQNAQEIFIEEQKRVTQFIRSLEKELVVLQKTIRVAGWSQRNAVVDHVHSDYQKQEKVLEKKRTWENLNLQCNVLPGILKVLLPHRDLYGFFDISKMNKEFKELLEAAEEREEYELAQLVHEYIAQFIKRVIS